METQKFTQPARNFPQGLSIRYVDFDIYEPPPPMLTDLPTEPDSRSHVPPNIAISWDPARYMKVDPATWTYPAEAWGKPFDQRSLRPGEGSPWGPRLDILDSRPPKPMKSLAPRPGLLGAEVRTLYNALSFKTWKKGRGFDTLITASARYLGISNHGEFSELIPQMNQAVKRWLANGLDKRRYRQARGCRPVSGIEHEYLYTLESGYVRGLHMHEMCVVPPALQKPFRDFLIGWWEMQACMAIPENAIHIKFAHSSSAKRQYERQQFWFRYLIKTMNPDMTVRKFDGSSQSMVDIMKPLWRWNLRPDVLPIACSQLYGISRNIDQGAQKRVGFVSKFDRRDFNSLYDGSEVTEAMARA